MMDRQVVLLGMLLAVICGVSPAGSQALKKGRSSCAERSDDLTREVATANVILLGFVGKVMRKPRTLQYDCEVKVVRVFKGEETLQNGISPSIDPVNNMVEVTGLGDPGICDNTAHVGDVKILFLGKGEEGRLRLNSSVVRITLGNLDRVRAAVIDVPYVTREPIEEGPCATILCAYGSVCQETLDNEAECFCPEECPDVFSPICGSDGVTYYNDCYLKSASCRIRRKIAVKSSGPCNSLTLCKEKECSFGAECMVTSDGTMARCVCPQECEDMDYVGVCGSDGVDYANECEMGRASCLQRRRITLIYDGICNPCARANFDASMSCQLNRNRQPIATCVLDCEGLPRVPVCASDGQMYDNECLVRQVACQSRFDLFVLEDSYCLPGTSPCLSFQCEYGKCIVDLSGNPTCRCIRCPDIYVPVCGSDHVTHHTVCHLQRAQCLSNEAIQVLANGPCLNQSEGICSMVRCGYGAMCVENDGNPTCSCNMMCMAEDKPVCGTDEVSYGNACLLKQAACEQQKVIDVQLEGLCNGCEFFTCEFGAICEMGAKGPKCVCPEECVKFDSPVCGSDSTTYPNECELNVQACRRQAVIEVVSQGECKEMSGSGDGSDQEVDGTDMALTRECDESLCQYGGRCEFMPNGNSYCSCMMNCPATRLPVCGSNQVTYGSECLLREASCEQQALIFVEMEGSCEDVEMEPCDGDSPLLLPNTLEEYTCTVQGEECPSGSYCHIHPLRNFAVCCKVTREQTLPPSCEDTMYGCCPDGTTAAQGFREAGCPSHCDCNELGSYSPVCNPTNKQCPCKPGVGGKKCDRCEPGFYDFLGIQDGNIGCRPCGCSKGGSVRDDCEQMMGKCMCKNKVMGIKCDICPKGMTITTSGCEEIVELVDASSSSLCEQLNCRYHASCTFTDGLATCVCPSDCTTEFDPVCGSDGQTYGNACQLKVFACRLQRDIQLDYKGICSNVVVTPVAISDSCLNSQFGCCDDDETPMANAEGVGCPLLPGMTTASMPSRAFMSSKPMEASMTTVPSRTSSDSSTHRTTSGIAEQSSVLSTSRRALDRGQISDMASSVPTIATTIPGRTSTISSTYPWTLSNLSRQPSFVSTSQESPASVQVQVSHRFSSVEATSQDSSVFTQGTPLLTIPQIRIRSTKASLKSILTSRMASAPSRQASQVTIGTDLESTTPIVSIEKLKGTPASSAHLTDLSTDKESTSTEMPVPRTHYRTPTSTYQASTNPHWDKSGTEKMPSKTDMFKNESSQTPFNQQSVSTSQKPSLSSAVSKPTAPITFSELTDAVETSPVSKVFIPAETLNSPTEPAITVELEATNLPTQLPTATEAMPVPICETSTCLHGGTCLEDEAELQGFSCSCPVGRGGPLCQEAVTFATPSFSENSYLAFPTIRGFFRFDMVLEFQSQDPAEGLLFFNGQNVIKNNDYVLLAIVNGSVEFRYNVAQEFDLGSSEAVEIRSTVPVRALQWYTVHVSRENHEASLSVDGEVPVKGASSERSSGLTLTSELFVGNVPEDKDLVYHLAGTMRGFIGCISYLEVNGKSVNLGHPGGAVLYGADVGECGNDPCLNEPCHNNGLCRARDAEKFDCECIDGFVGILCGDIFIDHCEGNMCYDGSTCAPLPEGGYRCDCPSGWEGDLCDQVIIPEPETLFLPGFTGNSYIQLPGFKAPSHITVDVEFIATQSNGMIFYIGQTTDGNGDFISLNLVDGFLDFRYNLGSGIAEIRSPTRLVLNEWHQVEAARVNKNGMLLVNGVSMAKGQSSGAAKQLNLRKDLFIGGTKSYSQLSRKAGITDGLVGSIKTFAIDKVPIVDLLEASISQVNIETFVAHPCSHRPCSHSYDCVVKGEGYSCKCPAGTVDMDVMCVAAEVTTSSRDVLGSPVPTVMVDVNAPVFFDGLSIFSYPNMATTAQNAQGTNLISLRFRTTALSGLLMYNAAHRRSGDFVVVAVVDGGVEFAMNLGKGVKRIRSSIAVSDNRWHTVTISRAERVASIQVDDETPVIDTAKPGASFLNTDGIMWIGGHSSLQSNVPTDYRPTFIGCIADIELGETSLLLYSDNREDRPTKSLCEYPDS